MRYRRQPSVGGDRSLLRRAWEPVRELSHESGLTEELLAPQTDRRLAEFGVGLTDVSKASRGMDANVSASEKDPARLIKLVAMHDPQMVAFNGKAAAQAVAAHLRVAGRSKLKYGDQGVWSGLGRVFILPSSSAANARMGLHTKLQFWKQLVKALG